MVDAFDYLDDYKELETIWGDRFFNSKLRCLHIWEILGDCDRAFINFIVDKFPNWFPELLPIQLESFIVYFLRGLMPDRNKYTYSHFGCAFVNCGISIRTYHQDYCDYRDYVVFHYHDRDFFDGVVKMIEIIICDKKSS